MKDIVINLERPIAFYPQLARVLGGIEEAIFVQQLIYWTPRAKDENGWVYKTREEWINETTISEWKIKNVIRKLEKLGIIERKKKHVNGIPIPHYQLQEEKLQNLLSVWDESSHSNGMNPPTPLYTETTNRESTYSRGEDMKTKKTSTAPKILRKPKEMMQDNNVRKDIRIIMGYAYWQDIDFTSLEEQRSFIKRFIRSARLLEPYDEDRIADTMNWLDANVNHKWTIETIGKYIDLPKEQLQKLAFNMRKDKQYAR
jgi:DNA-binding Lrp family transcriptional regulator